MARLVEVFEKYGAVEKDAQKEACIGALRALFNGEARVDVPLEEALRSEDFAPLFQEIISRDVVEPREPQYIVSEVLARVIRVERHAPVYRIPGIGPLRAFEIEEGAEIPAAAPEVFRYAAEIRVTKKGVRVAVTEELRELGEWNVWGYLVRAATTALRRLKEQLCFEAFTEVAGRAPVFDADNANLMPSGVDETGAKNGTLSILDIVDMAARLLANEYRPTDLLAHPLAWTIFAKDPFLRNLWVAPGIFGRGIFQEPRIDIAQYLPWTFQVHLTPFVKLDTTATPYKTDLFLVDRNDLIIILQVGEARAEEFDDPARDIHHLKVVEWYGIGVPNLGRAIAAALNIRLAEKKGPITIVKTV